MIENNNERRKKTITVTIIGVIVLLIILVGATYAYFSSRSKATPQQVTTAKVDLLVEIPDEAEHITNIKPTTWDNNIETNKLNNDISQIPIKVTNNSTIDVKYDLFITPSGLSLNVEDTDGDGNNLVGGELKDVKYKLYDEKGIEVVTGDFEKENKRQKIVANKNISKKVESSSENIQKYILYIYIENKDEAQNKLQGLDFNIDIEGVTPPEKIAQTILSNESIIEKWPNFSSNSTDKGLYKLRGDISTSDDGSTKDIYYYRGAVDNNYVQFGTYTKEVQNEVWDGSSYAQKTVAQKGQPMLWRIVKINEDRSVKLIAEHNIGLPIVWNSNGTTDYEGSIVKQTVEDWYEETFYSTLENCEECKNNKEIATLIQDTEFCNDRSNNYSAVSKRIYIINVDPTLKCSQEDIVKAKVGLMSADEMAYGGAGFLSSPDNNKPYLSNGTNFWSSSPYSSNSMYFFTQEAISNHRATESHEIRPVITLSSEASITSGSGTITDPWVLSVQ